FDPLRRAINRPVIDKNDFVIQPAQRDAQLFLQNRQVRFLVIRSEEHTSELQSPYDLVCRLLLEKKKINQIIKIYYQTNYIHLLLRLISYSQSFPFTHYSYLHIIHIPSPHLPSFPTRRSSDLFRSAPPCDQPTRHRQK